MSAVRRLDAAVVEQTRVRGQHEAAKGTSGELLQANASLCAADEQVTARGRWLEWVDERDYQVAAGCLLGDTTGSVLMQAKNRQAPPTLRRRPLIGQVIKRRRLIGPLKGPTERIAPIMRLGRGGRRSPC